MRNATVQRASTMIPIGGMRQAAEPHVRHAVSGAPVGASPSACDMVKCLGVGVFCPTRNAGRIAVRALEKGLSGF